jgi:hypothetical protein
MKYWLLFPLFVLTALKATSQIEVPDPQCPYCGYRLPQDPVSTSDPNYLYKYHSPTCSLIPVNSGSGGTVTPGPYIPSQPNQIKQMVTGMVLQSLITAIFTSNAQQTQQQEWEAQQAEMARLAEIARQQRIQDSINHVKHQQMMGLYKPLEGSGLDLGFKTLDGEMEMMRSQAGNMFDQGIAIEDAVDDFSQGTNFFGSMSEQEVNLLFEPESDPMIVDLREARSTLADTGAYGRFVDDLKNDEPVAQEKPELSEAECQRLEEKIDRDIENKARYQVSIDKTLTELEKWEEENRAAMLAAFREGLGFLTGKFVDMQNKKYEPAQNLRNAMKKVLEKEPDNNSAKKVIECLDKNYLNQSWREKIIRAYDEAKNADEAYDVIRDAMQNLFTGFSAVDKDLAALLESPELKPYLNDEAFMSACKFSAKYFIDLAMNSNRAQKALESVFKAKIPYVSLAQLAINQTYNATQWYQSRQRILELNEIHGKELETAQYLQNRIFSDQLKVDQQCK